jgi:hypothetical protein
MTLRQKSPGLQLDSKAYALLKNRVLEPDGWTRQNCGSVENLFFTSIIWNREACSVAIP